MRLALALVFAAAAACGGAAHASFDGGVYRNGPIAFRLPPVPPSWRRIDATDAALAFRDDPHDATVLVNARCRKADDDTPLVALTNHLLMGSTEREFVSQATEPFDGREALHTHVKSKWDGVPMELDIFVMKKDGCIYDFVFMAAPVGFAEGSAPFETVVKGFHTLAGSGVV